MVELIKTLILDGREYVLTGKIQNDRLEGEFGIYRQYSGGNLYISTEQVMNSLKLERIKLFSKLDVIFEEEDDVEHSCCDFDLHESEEDLEILSNCFTESSILSVIEKSSLCYICGYISLKEKLFADNAVPNKLPECYKFFISWLTISSTSRFI